MKKEYAAGAVACLILAAGVVTGLGHLCLGFPGSAQWELEVWVSGTEELENGTVIVDGEVALSGHVTGTTVEGITVVFEREDRTERTVRVGSLSGQSEREFSVRLPYMPETVLLETTDIRTGDDTGYWIKGVNRTSSGEYEQFVQAEHSC